VITEFLTTLDWLGEEFTATNQRLAITVAATGFVLLVLLSYRDVQSWLTKQTKPLYADILTTVLLLGSSVLSLLVIIGVWGVREDLSEVLTETGIGSEMIVRISISFVILVITYILWRFIKRLLHDVIASSTSVTDHQEEVTHRVVQVVLWSFSIVFVLGIWVDDLSGLLVGAGFLGIVLGMATRQTLATILAGFVLMLSRPFEVGHWIEIDDREGVVAEFSVFNTELQSFDGEYIIVPNDVVTSSIVTNRSKKGRLRVEVDVGIDYDADPEQAMTIARDALEGVEEVLDVPEPQVIVKRFGDSAIILSIRFWIDNPSSRKRWTAKTKATNAIKTQFGAADIKIPYPQRELMGREETAGLQIGSTPQEKTTRTEGDETPEAGEGEPNDQSSSEEPPAEPREGD